MPADQWNSDSEDEQEWAKIPADSTTDVPAAKETSSTPTKKETLLPTPEPKKKRKINSFKEFKIEKQPDLELMMKTFIPEKIKESQAKKAAKKFLDTTLQQRFGTFDLANMEKIEKEFDRIMTAKKKEAVDAEKAEKKALLEAEAKKKEDDEKKAKLAAEAKGETFVNDEDYFASFM